MHEGHREVYRAPFVLNATYASVNQVLEKVKGVTAEPFGLKYELCEIILCKTGDKLRDNIGLIATMDGLFLDYAFWAATGISFPDSGLLHRIRQRLRRYTAKSFFCVGADGNVCRGGWRDNSLNDCPWQTGECMGSIQTYAGEKCLRENIASVMKSLFSMKPILKALRRIIKMKPTDIHFESPHLHDGSYNEADCENVIFLRKRWIILKCPPHISGEAFQRKSY